MQRPLRRKYLGFVMIVALLEACAPTKPVKPRVLEVADYTKAVVVGGQRFSGGIAVLSSPEGDVLFVPNDNGIEVIDGETGKLRRQLRSPLPDADNIVRDGRRLILLSSQTGQVAVWDPANGEVASYFGFARPVNATHFGNALLIAELDRGAIARQEGDAEPDTFVAGMRVPAGLTGTARDLWVADRASGTVLQIVADGSQLSEPMEVANGLAQPEGLAVTRAGSLIIAETGVGRLLRLDPSARTMQVIDEGLALDASSGSDRNPIGPFASVAIGACGTIYVNADATGEIIRYVPSGPVVCSYGD